MRPARRRKLAEPPRRVKAGPPRRLLLALPRISYDGDTEQERHLATTQDFRRAALRLPEATEGAHMGHPDFRVRNKVFASLGVPDAAWGMVKLTPEQQEMLMAAEPGAFKPAAGAWGRRGSTHVRLAAVDATTLRSALTMAWRNVAPKGLVAKSRST